MTRGETQVGVRVLNRALLDRQLLTGRAHLTAQEAVAHLVGMQAQAVRPPYVGLWTRLVSFGIGDLEKLIEERVVVRTALMRSTLHLVLAQDCLALRPLLAEQLARTAHGQFGQQIMGVDLAELTRQARALVEDQPSTFAELGEHLASTWPGRRPNALSQTVRNLLPLVQVPPRGLWSSTAPARHATVASWLGRPLLDGASIEHYALRYLEAFGPASVRDMQKWSGMTRLAAAFSRLEPQLRRYHDDHGQLLYDLLDRELPDPDRELPVRYLPAFDNALLSHADRRRIIADEHRPRIFASGGVIRPTILVDGFVAGTWRLSHTEDSVDLVVEPFTPLGSTTRADLLEEGSALLRFAAPTAQDHRVHIATPR